MHHSILYTSADDIEAINLHFELMWPLRYKFLVLEKQKELQYSETWCLWEDFMYEARLDQSNNLIPVKLTRNAVSILNIVTLWNFRMYLLHFYVI